MENKLEIVTPNDLLMTKSPFTAEQLQLFYKETPKDKLMQRPAKGGGTWEYVKTGYVIDTLNRLFGYKWSFEVLTGLEEAAKIAASGTCVVKGRLTVYVDGGVLVKEQFGRCDVKYKTEYNPTTHKKEPTGKFLDFGNDMKGAASDALKKCASELGLFRDVYHKEDFASQDVKEYEELISEAVEALEGAEDMAALQGVWIRLSSDLRKDQSIVNLKDALKQKFLGEERSER